LTVLHLPNKNYRRIGKKGRLGGGTGDIEFATGKETFDTPHESLPTEMQVHLSIRKAFPVKAKNDKNYKGIVMVDEIGEEPHPQPHHPQRVLDKMAAYNEYVSRGGILSSKDIEDWSWL